LTDDLASMFGGLSKVCVSDDYARDRRVLAEGVLFLMLGAVCSVTTTYILASAGFLL
jgi:hypothetical protein